MAKLVVSGLLAASLLIGGFSYRRVIASERAVRAAAADLHARGPGLDGEGCVTEALTWGQQCTAMKVVCDEAITPLVKTCLQSTDRTEYCRGRGATLDTHFSFARCRERGFGRRDRRCAEAYLAVADHCRGLVGRVAHGGRP